MTASSRRNAGARKLAALTLWPTDPPFALFRKDSTMQKRCEFCGCEHPDDPPRPDFQRRYAGERLVIENGQLVLKRVADPTPQQGATRLDVEPVKPKE
jgi:hypothetical protein